MKNIPTKHNDWQEKERAHENKRAKKGSGPETTKGARIRTEIGLSKGLNKGGAHRTSVVTSSRVNRARIARKE